MRNPKNNFYRLLNLPKEEKEILKWYRSVIKEITNNSDKRVETKEKEK